MIEFVEVSSGESLGRVELKDGKLSAPMHLQSMVEAWLRRGKAPEEFMEYYGGDGWSNGYIYSKEVSGEGRAVEEEPAPEAELRVAKFAQNDKELSPVTVIEKLRDIVVADVKADTERGFAGEEAIREMDLYVQLINDAETDEDVRDIVEEILEEVPIEDYEGAEDIEEFLKTFIGDDEEPAKEEPAKTLRVFPRPLKKK